MSDLKPCLKNIHPNLEEYDGGVAYFVKPFGFCCENPWDYITSNGANPEYWHEHDSDYEAIEYYLEDRGWLEIIKRQASLEEKIKLLESEIKKKDKLLKHYSSAEFISRILFTKNTAFGGESIAEYLKRDDSHDYVKGTLFRMLGGNATILNGDKDE